MSPILALFIAACGITLFLFVEKKGNTISTNALWIPTIWMIIYASRPLARWIEPSGNENFELSIEAGSLVDRILLSILILMAALVINKRKFNWNLIIKDNIYLLLLFSYMGISIFWSDYPYTSFKRWIRSTGDILMAFVVLSEPKPLQSLESVFRRVAYILVPLSLVLVKYFPFYGRVYGRWDGLPMWTGVTTHKNSLGQLCALSAFFLIWGILREIKSGNLVYAKFINFVDAIVLGFSLFLLMGSGYSYSATSFAILMTGVIILITLNLKENFVVIISKRLKVLIILIIALYIIAGEYLVALFAPALGRDATLTGRTWEIWNPILEIASHNSIFGVGYGGFWGLEDPEIGVLQAHNGYIDVYLELGIVGVVFTSMFLISFSNKIKRELSYSYQWCIYGICLLIMTLTYNYSESSLLQSLSYIWTALVFLFVVFSEPCLHLNKSNNYRN